MPPITQELNTSHLSALFQQMQRLPRLLLHLPIVLHPHMHMEAHAKPSNRTRRQERAAVLADVLQRRVDAGLVQVAEAARVGVYEFIDTRGGGAAHLHLDVYEAFAEGGEDPGVR